MATTDTSGARDDADTPSDLAAVISEASFVHFVVARDGDSVAAAGVLGRAVQARATPVQVSVVTSPAQAEDRIEAADASTTCIGIGVGVDAATACVESVPRSGVAYAAVTELGDECDVPALAVAGAFNAGMGSDAIPGAVDSVRDAGGDWQAGIGTPTPDLMDGLTHSTRVHTSFSGDADAVEAFLDPVSVDGRVGGRELASALALEIGGDDDAPPRAGSAIEYLFRPLVLDAEWTTVEGLADVLDAAARIQPGAATAVALGHNGWNAAMDAWQRHGQAVHDAVKSVEWQRYTDLIVTQTTAPVGSTARVLRDFRAPEPAVLACSDGRVALATTDTDATRVLGEALTPDRVSGHPRLATATTADPTDVSANVREVL